MTKTELIAELNELSLLTDAEEAHVKADYALLEYIADEDIKAAFDEIERWYA